MPLQARWREEGEEERRRRRRRRGGEEEEHRHGQSATAVITKGLIADRKFPQSKVTFHS